MKSRVQALPALGGKISGHACTKVSGNTKVPLCGTLTFPVRASLIKEPVSGLSLQPDIKVEHISSHLASLSRLSELI